MGDPTDIDLTFPPNIPEGVRKEIAEYLNQADLGKQHVWILVESSEIEADAVAFIPRDKIEIHRHLSSQSAVTFKQDGRRFIEARYNPVCVYEGDEIGGELFFLEESA